MAKAKRKRHNQVPVVNLERNFGGFLDVDVRNDKKEEMKVKRHNQVPVVNLERNFGGFLNVDMRNDKKEEMKVKRHNQVPVVNLERNFGGFLDVDVKNDKKEEMKRKRHNCKVESTEQQKNVQKHKVPEYFDELENTSDKLIQNSQSNQKVLRERKKVDYKEKLSIGTPEVYPKPVHPDGGRIPIYKQFNSTQISDDGKHDQYAFVPDSDEDKGSDISFHIETPAKKRRIIRVHHIPRRRVGNVNYKENDTINSKTYENKIENIMQRVKNKVNKKNVEPNAQIHMNKYSEDNAKKKNHLFLKNMKNSSINMKLIFNGTPERETQQDLKKTFVEVATSNVQSISPHKKSLISHNQGYSRGNDINLNKNKSVNANVETKSTGYGIEASNALSDSSSPASNFGFVNAETLNSRDNLPQKFSSNKRIYVPNKENNVEDLFGFLEDIEADQKTPKKNRINIIQNIELSKSIISNHRVQQPKRISWRLNDSITRNPHFLQLKNNGLPNVSQDPVLDHTFDDRLSAVNTTTSVPPISKSLKQKSILNFVETNKEYFNEHHAIPSLFDVEDYCPIEVNPIDKENSNSNRIQVIKPTTKRSILGEINENIMAVKTSTPAKSKIPSEPMQIDVSLIEYEKDADIFDNFGFNSMSECEENEKVGGVTESKAKPFRLSIKSKQKRQPKKLPEKLIQPVRDSEVRKIVKVGEDPDFSELIENEGLECEKVALFEDADISKNITKCYKSKTKKKIVSTEENPNRKNKECKLSKEAKKWIKDFKQMCAEVENEELEMD